jgi:hypothetical protein
VYIWIKHVLPAGSVVDVSELVKRGPPLGRLLTSLPLSSYLKVLWLNPEIGHTQRIACYRDPYNVFRLLADDRDVAPCGNRAVRNRPC